MKVMDHGFRPLGFFLPFINSFVLSIASSLLETSVKANNSCFFKRMLSVCTFCFLNNFSLDYIGFFVPLIVGIFLSSHLYILKLTEFETHWLTICLFCIFAFATFLPRWLCFPISQSDVSESTQPLCSISKLGSLPESPFLQLE